MKMILSDEEIEVVLKEYESIGQIEEQLRNQLQSIRKQLKHLRVIRKIITPHVPPVKKFDDKIPN